MPVSFTVLRGILGLLCFLFAHFMGRAVERRFLRGDRKAALLTWLLRTAVTGAAVVWRSGFDRLAWIVLVLAVISAGLGFYAEWRPRQQDDLTKQIFPNG